MSDSGKYIFLYADDDEDDLLLIRNAFESHNDVQLHTFSDGTELLNFISEYPEHLPDPCLFILDMNMPRLNGREVFRRIRQEERFAQTPVVIFTTSSSMNDEQFSKENGLGYLTKPLDINAYHQIVDQFISYCHTDVKKSLKPQQV